MGNQASLRFANPWRVIEELLARYELLEQVDVPFPLGGCFGWWGYELGRFVEPSTRGRAARDLDLPDCDVAFFDSLVAFDHWLGKTWVISTGLQPDGSRCARRARRQADFWQWELEIAAHESPAAESPDPVRPPADVGSNMCRDDYLRAVGRAKDYIRSGHIYQVNLAHRLGAGPVATPWRLYERLAQVSPAPMAAFVSGEGYALASASPELFLRISGQHVRTQPIKGTRPRSSDSLRDAELARELVSSPKEQAELVMITDLLRHDLGRVCEFGSVSVPELRRLERFSHVQHLVATIEGRLRPDVSHLTALAGAFPGGSITGAPKVRAMQIIDELEVAARGPYTGAIGYLGFNRESQFSIAIRTAVCGGAGTWFHVGSGIVADSDPVAEYEETLAKGRAFGEAITTVSAAVGASPARTVFPVGT